MILLIASFFILIVVGLAASLLLWLADQRLDDIDRGDRYYWD